MGQKRLPYELDGIDATNCGAGSDVDVSKSANNLGAVVLNIFDAFLHLVLEQLALTIDCTWMGHHPSQWRDGNCSTSPRGGL